LKRNCWLLFVAFILSVFSGCKKDKGCSPKSASSELPQMQAFANAHNMTLTAHGSGLQYEILDMGNGPKANASSKISITYTGKFMNGQTFDEQLTPNIAPWALSGLIEGWIIGIPLINEGGHIRLLVPSSLAYGCQQYYDIPGNSVLYFDIRLVDVQ
jgi:FKBP-type peptidyl-prolyl cis-trans isomerase FkpA